MGGEHEKTAGVGTCNVIGSLVAQSGNRLGVPRFSKQIRLLSRVVAQVVEVLLRVARPITQDVLEAAVTHRDGMSTDILGDRYTALATTAAHQIHQ